MARPAPLFAVQEELFCDKLSRVVVNGNGNCLFYSLLTVAGRPLGDQMSLRELCADYFASRWLECPSRFGRRSSTYAARLNDCYSGEPAFRGMKPCFPDADAYVRYITRDQTWAGMSEIEIISLLWRRPIIVWSSDGLPTPGLINFVADVPPYNIVYSNGDHYDALVSVVSDAALVAATAALYTKGRALTLAVRADVVDLGSDVPLLSPEVVLAQPPTFVSNGIPRTRTPRRKAEKQVSSAATKGSRLDEGFRKAHTKWRVGFRPNIPNMSRSRLTIPFDYPTEDVANKVFQFVVQSLAGNEPDGSTSGLESSIVEHLKEFLLHLHSGTIDAHLSSVRARTLKGDQATTIPKSTLRGVLYNEAACDWLVRVKVRDVMGKEKSFKLPFRYRLEKDAALAYDFAILHFCLVIDQKMNHKLNYTIEKLALSYQTELKSYVEEVLTNSYSFQVGKTLPARPILRGVDKDNFGNFWTVRLSILACDNTFFVFLLPTWFESLEEVAFAYDHLMPKLRQFKERSLSFNPNFYDYIPSADLVDQVDLYFTAHLMLHPTLLSLAQNPDPVVPSSKEPISMKRLRGVLKRGSEFTVRIRVPNSADQAIVHHLPQMYPTGMEAALAYDCITRLLLPYRARPSPLNFVTSFATPETADNMATYFRIHLLPLLPDLEDSCDASEAPTRKGKMTLKQVKAYFLAQRQDGSVHPCCCCRRTWFRRCVVTLTDKFLEKIPNKIRNALTGLTGPDGNQRLCNTCYTSLRRWKAPKMYEANMPNFPVVPEELQDMTDMENHLV
jgi:hypothetical protein